MKFIFGLGLGFVFAIIFAPAGGSQTRSRIANKVRAWTSAPRRQMEEKISEIARKSEQRAGEVGSEVGRQAAEAAVRAVREEVLGEPKRKRG